MIVARSLLNRGYMFSLAGKRKSKRVKEQQQVRMEKDVFKAYRSEVENSSILR